MKEKCIVAISHSNYLFRNAGTEKCMREIAKLLNDHKIHYLQLYSFEDNSRLKRFAKMQGKIGVNFDKEFLGIYSTKDLLQLMKDVSDYYKVIYTGIHIHNILNHDCIELKNNLLKLNLPIVLWLHDYTAICPVSPILLTNGDLCCNNFIRAPQICRNCKYGKGISQIHADVTEFYQALDHLITQIVAPSESVKRNILIAYPFWKERIYIREHLKLYDVNNKSTLHEPIRIAFVGGKFNHKGIREWKTVVNYFRNQSNYEFYYLGASTEKNDSNVKSIFVDTSLQGEKTMSYTAKVNMIDIAFLWSACQETYSYTYFEMRSVGAKILTFINSGNIADMVRSDNSGLVFSDLDELIQLMDNYDKFCQTILACSSSYFSNYRINDDIDKLIPNGNVNFENVHGSFHKHSFLSLIHKACNIYKNKRAWRKMI